MPADKSKVRTIINHHIILTMGAGAIPIPIVDIAAVTAIQLEMVKSICEAYEVDYSTKISRSIIMSIVGNTLMSLALRSGGSLLKFIPGIGTLTGGGVQVILSGASTFGIGQAFIWHLDKSETLEDFDIEEGKKVYKEELEKGKEIVKDLKNKEEAETTVDKELEDESVNEITEKDTNKTDIYEQLERLGRLKETGVLTEDEFARQKAKLLDD